jgi:hypothetical protein
MTIEFELQHFFTIGYITTRENYREFITNIYVRIVNGKMYGLNGQGKKPIDYLVE